MLRITIEVVPHGDQHRAFKIGVGQIANVSQGDGNICDYKFKFEEDEWEGSSRGPFTGELRQWPRDSYGAWDILRAALEVALSARS
jgi:hypothetical protein